MRAFVAGATGLTGRYVVEALVEAGVEVFAHVRPDSQSMRRWQTHFEELGAAIDATPWEALAMGETMKRLQPTLVFALLGTTRKRSAREGGDYLSIDYGLTALLVDAVAAGPRARFIYLSAVGASARSTGAYMKARWLAEERVRASELPYLIARPSFIVGDRDEPRAGENIGSRLSDAALGVVGLLGIGRWAAQYRSIEGRQLAQGLVRAAVHWEQDQRIIYSPQLAESP